MRSAIRNGAMVWAIILGACSQDSTGSQATPLLDADVALVVADNTGETVDVMREPVLFPVLTPAFSAGFGDFNPSVNCSYNSTTKRLECPPVTRDAGKLTITRSYAFWDASNVSQDHFDALLTAKANVQVHATGERDQPNWSATVDRSRDLTATGLAGDETERTWNGTGSNHITRSRHSDNGQARSYDLDCSFTVTDVVVPVPRGADRFPISGSISHTCTVTFVGGPKDGQTITRSATVTFNGTETVTLTVNGHAFDLDLKTRHRGERGG
jgi:hypothetical protein